MIYYDLAMCLFLVAPSIAVLALVALREAFDNRPSGRRGHDLY